MSDDPPGSDDQEEIRGLIEGLRQLSPEDLEKVAKAVGTVRQARETLSVLWSAPLPPPSLLHEYDEIVEGTAKRIIDAGLGMASSIPKLERLKVWGAIWLGTGLLGIAALAAYNGNPWIAVPLGLAGPFSAVLGWLSGRNR
jgi:hypothetical protein